MKNNRGFLLGEFTLKVLVAIFCILLLVFLLFKVYATFTSKSDLEKAEATVDRVIEKIDLAIAENKEQNYVLIQPKNWFLIYNPQETRECVSECLCICREVGECGKGICKRVIKNLIMDVIKINKAVDITIRNEENGVIIK